MRENMTIQNLYDLRNTMARPLLENLTYPWEALPLIGAFIVELGKTLSPDDYELRGENIWVAKSAKLYPNIYIAGPAIIGPNTEAVSYTHLDVYKRQRELRAVLRYLPHRDARVRRQVLRRAGDLVFGNECGFIPRAVDVDRAVRRERCV